MKKMKSRKNVSQQPQKVLIIEDEKPLAKALCLKFEHNGFHVENAGNGEVALKILEKETFDVIILDLIMPKVNGFSVMEELQKRKTKIPVFVLTSLSQEEDKKKTAELGAHELFVKSDIPVADIVEKVQTFLNKK
ncbi:MAG: response regulator [Candidatus Paceibacterota bacterium]